MRWLTQSWRLWWYCLISLRAGSLDERFGLFRLIGGIVLPEYRFKWPHLDWWANRGFDDYLRTFAELDGNNADRRWTLWQLLTLVDAIPGNTAECGVYAGASSYLMCRRNALFPHMRRMHFLCDSFEGLSAPGVHDGQYWRAGNLACDEQVVKKNLAEFSESTVYARGWIPESFAKLPESRYCFVHIDVDLYQPTLDSVEYFYPRMEPGAVLLCDDYGFQTCPGATRALDEYFADKSEKPLALCSGGGFVIKGCRTEFPGSKF